MVSHCNQPPATVESSIDVFPAVYLDKLQQFVLIEIRQLDNLEKGFAELSVRLFHYPFDFALVHVRKRPYDLPTGKRLSDWYKVIGKPAQAITEPL